MEKSLRCQGMRDLLPSAMERFRQVEEAFRQVCLAWGYREVRTPTLEYLHLFTTTGTLSPQMLGRVYSFLDWDGWRGERVVLRPDATIPAVRLFVEHLASRGQARLCYVQNVFRFTEGEEPRESWQCGAELLGEKSPLGDLELILVALEALQSLGLESLRVRLSHAGLLRAALARTGLGPQEQAVLYDRLLDGELAALDGVKEELSARLLFGLEGGGPGYLANLRSALAPWPELAAPLEEIGLLGEALEALGHRYEVWPALVRNFEYYTGPIFHLLVDEERVGGGGRYDALAGLLGASGVPASGFALDMDRLGALLPGRERPTWPQGVLVQPVGEDAATLAAAFAIARSLHSRGREAQVAQKEAETSRWQVLVQAEGGPVVYTVTDRLEGWQRQFTSAEEALAALGNPPKAGSGMGTTGRAAGPGGSGMKGDGQK